MKKSSKYKNHINMGVSKNNGTPKSSILIGFSIINHPFWGFPLFLETPKSTIQPSIKKMFDLPFTSTNQKYFAMLLSSKRRNLKEQRPRSRAARAELLGLVPKMSVMRSQAWEPKGAPQCQPQEIWPKIKGLLKMVVFHALLIKAILFSRCFSGGNHKRELITHTTCCWWFVKMFIKTCSK